jgi:hypothetical protein
MPTIPASEFVRAFGRFKDEAHRELVKVTSHGRIVGAYLSAADLELFERLKRREREVLVVGNLPADAVAAIADADYDAPSR